MSQQEQAPTIPVGAALPLARPAAKPQVLVAGLSRVGRELVRRLRAKYRSGPHPATKNLHAAAFGFYNSGIILI